jgi:apolipoprotein N-acyltransferase
MPRWLAVVTALLSGVAVLLAFPPYGLWWLAPIGVGLLTIAVFGQRLLFAALLGLLHGLAFFVPLLHWTGLYVGAWPWLLLATVEALYLAGMAVLLAVLCRLGASWPNWLPVLLPLATASVWVTQEAIRSRVPFGGFGWGRLAFSQAESVLLPNAMLGGAPAVTFAVGLLGGIAAAGFVIVHNKLWPIPARPMQSLAGAVTAIVLLGLPFIATVLSANHPTGQKVTVAVVQGNVPRAGLGFNAQRRAVLENHVTATIRLADQVRQGKTQQPDIVIWPENSSDIDPLRNPDAAARIDEAVRAIQAPILVGAILDGPGRFISNTGLVWTVHNGPSQRYVKRHPVPFAEYVPFRGFTRTITSKVDLVRKDFHPGADPGVLRLGNVTVGDVICFEVVYDKLVADTVRGGAQLLVVQTNNATFGRSAESKQQLAMVQLRAVEHGRYAVMASTTGVSAIVDPAGNARHTTPLFTQRVIVDDIRLSSGRTIATRVGAWPEWVLTFFCGASIVAEWRRIRKAPRAPAPSRS